MFNMPFMDDLRAPEREPSVVGPNVRENDETPPAHSSSLLLEHPFTVVPRAAHLTCPKHS